MNDDDDDAEQADNEPKPEEPKERKREHREWVNVPAAELHLELKERSQRNRRHLFRRH
ncbi:MAG: hypothetical protein U0228_28220 [Myxococcaceae bacterium]